MQIAGNMTQDTIPDDVRRFILTSIGSVPFLEAMLLMRRHSATGWNASMLAQRLYVVEKSAEELLLALQDAGYVKPAQGAEGFYRYSPLTEDLGRMCDRLAEVYARHIVGVTTLIHSNVDKRAQRFADAFKWRKD